MSDDTFTEEEIGALCRILEPHYIDYEDREAHNVVNKLFKLKKEYDDMDRGNSQITKRIGESD